MSERKAFLEGKIAELKAEKEQGVSISRLEVIDKELSIHEGELQAIIAADIEQEQQVAALQVRIQEQEVKREGYTLPTNLNTFFSNSSYLNADGEPYEVTSANKIVLQIVKDALTENDTEHNAKYAVLENKYSTDMSALRSERDRIKAEYEDQTQVLETLRQQLSQAIIERDEALAKRDAAMEDKKQREAKESEDLAKLIADEQAEKDQKAAEDRAKRTVYDVKGDSDIKGVESRNFTAKLAATGETITYNWTQKRYYIELTDENEILQFRQQHGQSESNQSDNAEDTVSISDSVTTEATFPEVPSAIPPQVPAIPAPVVEGQQSVEVPGETVEERLAALEAHVFGFVKQAVA